MTNKTAYCLDADAYCLRCFLYGHLTNSGEISEVRIWSRQRTQDELNALNAFYTVDPGSEGLIAYWKFDEGSGKTIKDYSGNGNDIEAANDLTWTRVSLPE